MYFQAQPPQEKLNFLTSSYFTGKSMEEVDALIYMGSLDVSRDQKTV